MAGTSAVLFPWDNSYSVNVAAMDSQHKNLVGIINELHQAMSTGSGKNKLSEILSKLIGYTKGHFAAEEGLLQSHAYPDLASQKAEHERLTGTVMNFQRRFLSNEIGLTVEVMDFLKNWLRTHILDLDKKYSPFLNGKGVR